MPLFVPAFALLIAVVAPIVAFAGSATSSVAASKGAVLRILVTGIYVDCSWPAGTVILTLGVTGGDGNTVTYSLGGTPTGDLAISGSNLVVGSSGVATGNCNKVEGLTINATQP